MFRFAKCRVFIVKRPVVCFQGLFTWLILSSHLCHVDFAWLVIVGCDFLFYYDWILIWFPLYIILYQDKWVGQGFLCIYWCLLLYCLFVLYSASIWSKYKQLFWIGGNYIVYLSVCVTQRIVEKMCCYWYMSLSAAMLSLIIVW